MRTQIQMGVAPPPFVTVTEEVNATNAHYPGQLGETPEGRLLTTYLTSTANIADDVVASYNQFVIEKLPQQLEALHVRVNLPAGRQANGTILPPGVIGFVGYENPIFVRPAYSDKSGTRPMTPENARRHRLTYEATLYAWARLFYYNQANEPVVLERSAGPKEVCRLPVMRGSVLDNIAHITDPVELLRLGEDPACPMGGFVINGGEKIIMNIDKLQLSKIFVFPDTADGASPLVRITVPTPTGTRQMQLIINNDRAVHLQMGVFKKNETGKKVNTINILHFIEIVNLLTARRAEYEAANIATTFQVMVYRFIKKNQWTKIATLIAHTIVGYRIQSTASAYNKLVNDMGIAALPEHERRDKLMDMIVNQFFPNIPYAQFTTKVSMLAIMTARLFQYVAGFAEASNRNWWANKQISQAGDSVSQLFRGELRGAFYKAQDNVTKHSYNTLSDVIALIRPDEISKKIASAFGNNGWGVDACFARANLCDPVEAHNLLTYISHLTKIDVKTDRKSKSLLVRGVQPDQAFYICPIKTPDDRACGIIKNKALTCYVTHDTPDVDLIAVLKRNRYVVDNKTEQQPDYVLVNGVYIGWCDPNILYNVFVKQRRNGWVHRHAEIVRGDMGYVEICTTSGRLVRPVLVVTENGRAAVDEFKTRDRPFHELLELGHVQFLSAAESRTVASASSSEVLQERLDKIAKYQRDVLTYKLQQSTAEPITIEEKIAAADLRRSLRLAEANLIKESRPYEYAEIHPATMLSHSGSTIPLLNFNNTTRGSYQAKMNVQANSITPSNPYRFDGTTISMAYPVQPLLRSVVNKPLGLNTHPAGAPVLLGIAAITGFNQEDSFIFNRAALERGLFMYVKEFVVNTRVTVNNRLTQRLALPTVDPSELKRYEYINEQGLPSIGAPLNERDCVIGKVQEIAGTPKGTIVNVSEFLPVGTYGTVVDVRVVMTKDGLFVSVKLRIVQSPIIGDKFVFSPSQKGTVGLILNEEDMPFNEFGERLDVIINPHSIPSRTSIGLIIEILIGLALALSGRQYDATAFQKVDIELFKKILYDNGYASGGKQRFYSGTSGEPLTYDIYSGIAYAQALLHLAADKAQWRARGVVNEITRQAPKGESVRTGEMEIKAAMTHGASYFVQERLCALSDAYQMAYCVQCGMMATNDPGKGRYACPLCEENTIIGTVSTSYVFKYLTQLLASMDYLLSSNLIPEEEFVTKYDQQPQVPGTDIVEDDEIINQEEFNEQQQGASEAINNLGLNDIEALESGDENDYLKGVNTEEGDLYDYEEQGYNQFGYEEEVGDYY